MRYAITYWNNALKTVEADSLRTVFETEFGGPVKETGYNAKGVWLATDDGITGTVINNHGDECATIAPAAR